MQCNAMVEWFTEHRRRQDGKIQSGKYVHRQLDYQGIHLQLFHRCHGPIRFNALSIFILIESSSIYSGMLDAIYQNRCDLKCSVPNATQQRHYRTIMVSLLIHVLCYMAWHCILHTVIPYRLFNAIYNLI